MNRQIPHSSGEFQAPQLQRKLKRAGLANKKIQQFYSRSTAAWQLFRYRHHIFARMWILLVAAVNIKLPVVPG